MCRNFYFLVFAFRISVTYRYMWKYVAFTNILFLCTYYVLYILTTQCYDFVKCVFSSTKLKCTDRNKKEFTEKLFTEN